MYRTRAILSRSWIQAIHKDRLFWKNLLKNKEIVFENGVQNIQAAAYNGARTVFVNFLQEFICCLQIVCCKDRGGGRKSYLVKAYPFFRK